MNWTPTGIFVSREKPAGIDDALVAVKAELEKML